MLHFFQRQLVTGQVYPCSLSDIEERLQRVPQEHLEGLWAVGLVSNTRKDNSADGRYIRDPRPAIHILSYPDSLTVKMPYDVKRGDIEPYFFYELSFGVEVEEVGSRLALVWSQENLRRCILDHVLLHEVGHHVTAMERRASGYQTRLQHKSSEMLADHYADRQNPQP